MAGWRRGEVRKRSNACWTNTVKAARGVRSTAGDKALRHHARLLPSSPNSQDTTATRMVKLTAPAEPAADFALVLRNGRRIESNWNFRDADLARLIRVAEAK